MSTQQSQWREMPVIRWNEAKMQEIQWRGEYVRAMIEDGSAHPFAIYSQAVRVASLALDVLGRE
jgi:hypothetical protein